MKFMGWNFFAEKKLGRSIYCTFLLHKEYSKNPRNKVWNQANSHGFHVIHVYYSKQHLNILFFLLYAALIFLSPF